MEKPSNECLPPLVEEIKATLVDARVPTPLEEIIDDALRQPGHVFANPPGLKWPLFVLLACRSASGGTWRQALPAAAALEFMSAALEIIDDIQDGDRGPVQEKYGEAQALNAAFELFVLAHQAIWRLSGYGVTPGKCIAVAQALSAAAAEVGAGQHLDLLYEGYAAISADECLDVAAKKSASLVACAMRIGALLGTRAGSLVEKYAEFGWHLGMYNQLANDVKDVSPGSQTKSDIRRGKKTLPLVYAQNNPGQPNWKPGTDEGRWRGELLRSGALHYAWVIAESHRQTAKEILSALEKARDAEAILGPLTEAKRGLL